MGILIRRLPTLFMMPFCAFRFGNASADATVHKIISNQIRRSNFRLIVAASTIALRRCSRFLRSFLVSEANLTDWNRLSSEQTRKATAITAKSCSVLYLTVWVKMDGGEEGG